MHYKDADYICQYPQLTFDPTPAYNNLQKVGSFLQHIPQLPRSFISTAEIAENLEKYRSWFPLYETVQSRLFEELSAGQKQMMLILAALVADARYLLLDEPTEGLDLNHKQMLTDLLRKLKTFKTILITSHDAGFITTLSDHMVFLKEGRIVLDTPGMELSDFLETYHQYYLDEGEVKGNIL